MKSIILCADDYGITPQVGEAVRELAVAGRLSAVSCLSGSPAWRSEADRLQPLRGRVAVGLHFNLTLGFERSAPALAGWVGRSLSGRVDQDLVGGEVRRQLDRFEAAWGGPPDFLDGHQHVHVFPGVRRPVLRILAERYRGPERPWIRQVNPALGGHDAPAKAMVLKILSAGFVGEARQAGVIVTGGFDGLYSLSAKADYPAMMAGWLRRARPGTVVMCHPGICAGDDPEGIGPARLREYRYLRGEEFKELLREEGISLSSEHPSRRGPGDDSVPRSGLFSEIIR